MWLVVVLAFLSGASLTNLSWVIPSAVARGGQDVLACIGLTVAGIFFGSLAVLAARAESANGKDPAPNSPAGGNER